MFFPKAVSQPLTNLKKIKALLPDFDLKPSLVYIYLKDAV